MLIHLIKYLAILQDWKNIIMIYITIYCISIMPFNIQKKNRTENQQESSNDVAILPDLDYDQL